METIPRIYAPISVRNDRIISLLSSVLMRKMRQSQATLNTFPSSLEIGTTTVAIVLVTNTSTSFQQLLFQFTQNTCLHLFVVNDTANNAHEQFQSLNQLIDPCIPLLFVTDGPSLHNEKVNPLFESSSRRRVWSIHLFPRQVPTVISQLNSRILVLNNDEQKQMVHSSSPDTICVVVSPGTISDVWKCRLILKYIQAMACIENTNAPYSKL